MDETGVTGRVLIDATDKLKLDLKARYSKVKFGGVTFNASLALADAAAAGFGPLFFEDPNNHRFLYINRNKPDNQQRSLNLSAKSNYDFTQY